MAAFSFAVETQSNLGVVQAVRTQLARIQRHQRLELPSNLPPTERSAPKYPMSKPGGGLIFISGELISQLESLASAIAALSPEVPILIAAGAGVLNEGNEFENTSAASGLFWSGGTLSVDLIQPQDAGSPAALSAELIRAAGGRAQQLLIFPHEKLANSLELQAALKHPKLPSLYGASTLGPQGICLIEPQGELRFGDREKGTLGVAALEGLPVANLTSSNAFQLLSPFERVTDAQQKRLNQLGGEPALRRLKAIQHRITERRPLVLVEAIKAQAAPEYQPLFSLSSAPSLTAHILRGIEGIDPKQQSLLLSSPLEAGAEVAFAVPHALNGRKHLSQAISQLHSSLRGAQPCFGLYFNSQERGVNLYQESHMDIRIIARRMPELPFAGLISKYQIGPLQGHAVIHRYASIFGVVPSFS